MVDPDFVWPRTDGRPFALLAVINLATFAGAEALDVLPDKGYLNVFADIDSTLLGVSPDRLGGLMLEHAKGGLYEQRHTPSGVHQTIAVGLEAVEQMSLPHPSESLLDGLRAEYGTEARQGLGRGARQGRRTTPPALRLARPGQRAPRRPPEACGRRTG